MTYIILIAVSLILLGGFMLLTAFEHSRKLRVAGALRNRLDAKVARAAFVIRHVDWGAFVKHLAVTAFERAAHDLAHAVLVLVRSLERALTRAVKYLRARRGAAPLPEDGSSERPLERAMLHVRAALRNARFVKRQRAREAAAKE